MKNIIILIAAAFFSLLPQVSSAYTGQLIGETLHYRVYSYQVGHGQTAIVYELKSPDVAPGIPSATMRLQNADKQMNTSVHSDGSNFWQTQVTIPGGIN